MQEVSQQVVVKNPEGLHLRPADLLVRCAKQYESEIEISKDGNRVSVNSILDIAMLGASANSTLVIHAKGADAESALQALVRLFESKFEVENESNTASS